MTVDAAVRTATVERLADLMRRIAEDKLDDAIVLDETVELRAVKVNSLTMRAFLAAVEQEFGVLWDIDTPDEVFKTFGTLADHLAAAAK